MEFDGDYSRKYYVAGESILNRSGFDQSFENRNDINVEKKEEVSKKPTKSRYTRTIMKSQEIKEPPEVIYKFIKDEYEKKKGIQIIIGVIRADDKKEEAKNKEVRKRVKPLIEFWEEHFVKVKHKDTLSETISKCTKRQIEEILSQCILKEINENMERQDKQKQDEKELEKHKKLEEEKMLFQKALNFHYGFEKESKNDKQYMEKLVWIYREVNLKFPEDPQELFNWWSQYNRKKEFKIDNTENYTKDLIDDFYSKESKFSRLLQLYKQTNKLSPQNSKQMLTYWSNIKVM